jgi:hypothetical protein
MPNVRFIGSNKMTSFYRANDVAEFSTTMAALVINGGEFRTAVSHWELAQDLTPLAECRAQLRSPVQTWPELYQLLLRNKYEKLLKQGDSWLILVNHEGAWSLWQENVGMGDPFMLLGEYPGWWDGTFYSTATYATIKAFVTFNGQPSAACAASPQAQASAPPPPRP